MARFANYAQFYTYVNGKAVHCCGTDATMRVDGRFGPDRAFDQAQAHKSRLGKRQFQGVRFFRGELAAGRPWQPVSEVLELWPL